MNTALKRTPLYENHKQLGGKIVPFAGWELPVQYSSVIGEHQAVRTRAGLFDVSHMGEILVTGPDAQDALQYLTCNDVRALTDGKAQYSAILNEKGGVVDDIIIYRYSSERYLICVNASNSDRDFEWLRSSPLSPLRGHTKNPSNVRFENVSAQYGQIALQGPKAVEIVRDLGERTRTSVSSILNLGSFHFCECTLAGINIIAARTGYTGEDGFEFFVPWAKSAELWNALLEFGTPHGLIPCGLGARDSLRLEACYPLHGHELGEDISALESGLGWVVKFDKGDFLGKPALLKEKENGIPRALVGFFVEDPGIVRNPDPIYSTEGSHIGYTTSGTKTPTINRALGLALVTRAVSKEGTTIEAEVRGKRLKCKVVKKPFYKRQ